MLCLEGMIWSFQTAQNRIAIKQLGDTDNIINIEKRKVYNIEYLYEL